MRLFGNQNLTEKNGRPPSSWSSVAASQVPLIKDRFDDASQNSATAGATPPVTYSPKRIPKSWKRSNASWSDEIEMKKDRGVKSIIKRVSCPFGNHKGHYQEHSEFVDGDYLEEQIFRRNDTLTRALTQRNATLKPVAYLAEDSEEPVSTHLVILENPDKSGQGTVPINTKNDAFRNSRYSPNQPRQINYENSDILKSNSDISDILNGETDEPFVIQEDNFNSVYDNLYTDDDSMTMGSTGTGTYDVSTGTYGSGHTYHSPMKPAKPTPIPSSTPTPTTSSTARDHPQNTTAKAQDHIAIALLKPRISKKKAVLYNDATAQSSCNGVVVKDVLSDVGAVTKEVFKDFRDSFRCIVDVTKDTAIQWNHPVEKEGRAKQKKTKERARQAQL